MKQKIAITGGIGSGKSIVGKILQEKGRTVYSCDEIYKEVILSRAYIDEVRIKFPSCIKNGEINRKLLATIVFNDPQKLNQLNQIAHPLIMKKLNEYMDTCKDSIVFAEVPLLFECGYEHLFDRILVVQRTQSDRVKAIMERDTLSKEEILARMDAQFPYNTPEGEKHIQEIHAYQIFNNGTIDALKSQIDTFLNTFVLQS